VDTAIGSGPFRGVRRPRHGAPRRPCDVVGNHKRANGLFGYVSGAWPPHRHNDFADYLRHVRHTLAGHAAARRAIKARRPQALVSMALPQSSRSGALRRPHRPRRRMGVRLALAGRVLRAAAPTLDWLGVDYYFRIFVRWDVLPWRFFDPPEMGPTRKLVSAARSPA